MGERHHVSNKPDTTISSRALLKEFYECILNGNSFVNVRAIAKNEGRKESTSAFEFGYKSRENVTL